MFDQLDTGGVQAGQCDDSQLAVISASAVAVNGTAVDQAGRSIPPTSSDSFGHMTGGHSPDGVAVEDMIAFGGATVGTTLAGRMETGVYGVGEDADNGWGGVGFCGYGLGVGGLADGGLGGGELFGYGLGGDWVFDGGLGGVCVLDGAAVTVGAVGWAAVIGV
nr:acanthoscurrin-2-like [Aegilops tauschii subsp. strangulata]